MTFELLKYFFHFVVFMFVYTYVKRQSLVIVNINLEVLFVLETM